MGQDFSDSNVSFKNVRLDFRISYSDFSESSRYVKTAQYTYMTE